MPSPHINRVGLPNRLLDGNTPTRFPSTPLSAIYRYARRAWQIDSNLQCYRTFSLRFMYPVKPSTNDSRALLLPEEMVPLLVVSPVRLIIRSFQRFGPDCLPPQKSNDKGPFLNQRTRYASPLAEVGVCDANHSHSPTEEFLA